MTNAAIFFHPDGYATDRERLMGRHSAGESFLRGYIRHADLDRLHLWKAKNQGHEAFEALLNAIEPPTRPVRWIAMQDRMGLDDPGCVFIPSPTIAEEAWRRRRYGRDRYSVCGLTHTTATHRAIDALADLVISPLESWDGLICTSDAVRRSVELQLEAVREDLRLRLGATRLPQPQLATLPLGVNGEDFRHDPQARAAWRSCRAGRSCGRRRRICPASSGRICPVRTCPPWPRRRARSSACLLSRMGSCPSTSTAGLSAS